MGQASAPARDALIEAHVGLVRALADRRKQRLPAWIRRTDLEAEGYLGLVQAAGRFRANAGVPFDAFARLRISGAMTDYLRFLSPEISRRGWRELRETGETTVPQWTTVEFDEATYRQVMPGPDASPEDQAIQAERVTRLQQALGTLPRREQAILASYYTQGRTLADIGTDHGITESRVSQLRTQALARLRVALVVAERRHGFPSSAAHATKNLARRGTSEMSTARATAGAGRGPS